MAITFKIVLDILSRDTKIQYPIVIMALTDNPSISNGYAFDPEEEFGLDIPYQRTIGFVRVLKNSDGTFYSAKTFVLRSHRRLKIATRMYQLIQEYTNNKLVRSNILSEDGIKFTKKYFSMALDKLDE